MAERIDDVLAEYAGKLENTAENEAETAEEAESVPAGSEQVPAMEAVAEDAAPVTEAPVDEEVSTPETQNNAEGDLTWRAMNAAEEATAALGEARRENEELKAAVEELRKQLQGQSEQAAEAIQSITAPDFPDFDERYYSPEEKKAAMQKYINDVTAAITQGVMGELKPMREKYEADAAEAGRQRVLSEMAANPVFPGFSDNVSAMDDIISKTAALSSLPPEERYAVAYLIKRGVDSMNAPVPAEKSVDDIVAEVMSNPDALRAIESRRAAEIAEKNASVPRQKAAMGTMPTVAPKKPATLDEVRKWALERFGK